MNAPKVLVCDDEQAIRESLAMILEFEDYQVEPAASGEAAIAAMAKDAADLVLLDIKMPGLDGIEVLERLKSRWPDVAVLMISGHGDVSTAVECLRKGADDYFEKPLDKDRLLARIKVALGNRRLRRQNTRLREEVDHRYRLIGESRAMLRVRQMIGQVAPTDARVLILGENGTGKELVARAIHRESARAAEPFVDVNCAAIPSELIESELFGHRRGAFTGASEDRKGKFELAHRGTIFLDEIGDMSLNAQAKMLRVLQESKLERVGDTTSITIDARVVAATNKDLNAAVAAGQFRQDLLYRLEVVVIDVPPLRERAGDIPALVATFLEQAGRSNNLPLKRVDAKVLDLLMARDWPGNIRQLKNLVERLVILTPGNEIGPSDVQLMASGPAPRPEALFARCRTYEEFKDLSERLFLEEKLRANAWNVKKTAEELDMQRSNLYKKIEKFGMQREPG